jgi:hypothetical protein
MKWLTRDGSAETIYGINGELFRGVTHEIPLNSGSQSATNFSAFEKVTWTGGTAQMLAINDVNAGTKMWIQILTGIPPTTGQTITGVTSTATINTSGSVIERPLSKPFCGASTGSAIIGSYGFGIQTADLLATDKVTDLDANLRTPPNNVTNTVDGLANGEDYVLVAPWDGVTYDTNGDPAITKTQFSLTTALTTDNITAVVVDEVIPGDTPPAGYLRVTDDNGFERRLHYTAYDGPTKTFTIDTTDGNEDFAGVNATAGNDIYLGYIDQLAGASSVSYTSVQTGTRALVVIVRDGGGSPIKQFISPWSQTSSNKTITAIRTTDV